MEIQQNTATVHELILYAGVLYLGHQAVPLFYPVPTLNLYTSVTCYIYGRIVHY